MSSSKRTKTRVRQLREGLGIGSIAEFYNANRVYLDQRDISESLFRSIDNGNRPTTLDSARVLASLFRDLGADVTVNELLPQEKAAGIDDIEVAHGVVPIDAEIQMGSWLDMALVEGLETQRLPAIPDVKGARRWRALRIKDESINKYAGKGEYVLYRPLRDSDLKDLRQYDGELLFVEIVLAGRVERSVRYAQIHKGGYLKLTGYSTHLKFMQSPARYPCTDDAVFIRGVIVARFGEGGPRALSTRT